MVFTLRPFSISIYSRNCVLSPFRSVAIRRTIIVPLDAVISGGILMIRYGTHHRQETPGVRVPKTRTGGRDIYRARQTPRYPSAGNRNTESHAGRGSRAHSNTTSALARKHAAPDPTLVRIFRHSQIELETGPL